MVARDKSTGELGVCVATAVPAVGDRVLHVKAGVGAIATQALTSTWYGITGVKLLEMGFSPENALKAMLNEDSRRDVRQVFMIDSRGRAAAHTGKKTQEWKGHIIGENFVVGGNLLAGEHVIREMAKGFIRTRGELEDKLLKALEVAQAAGGDRRGKQSAAIMVEKRRRSSDLSPYLNLRVDEHAEPVRELRRIYMIWKKR